jgi:hypothetical protein
MKWFIYGAAVLGAYLGYVKVAKTPLQKMLTGMEPPAA